MRAGTVWPEPALEPRERIRVCVTVRTGVNLPGDAGSLEPVEDGRRLNGPFSARDRVRISTRSRPYEVIPVGIGARGSRREPLVGDRELRSQPVVVFEVLRGVEAHRADALLVRNCWVGASRPGSGAGGSNHKTIHPRRV